MRRAVPEPIDPGVHRALAGPSRVRLLVLLREHGRPVTVTDVTAQVDLHPNTVRLHLEQLARAGLVTRGFGKPQGPGRPPVVYTAAAQEPDARGDGYENLADILAGRLAGRLGGASAQSQAGSAAAGREWGSTWAHDAVAGSPPAPGQALERVVGLLDDLGFAPRKAEDGRTIELHRCPFLQVARRYPEVVCAVHLGLLQGALAELRAPVRATRLEPFVSPSVCLAWLEPVAEATPA